MYTRLKFLFIYLFLFTTGLVAEGMAKVKIFDAKRDEKDKAIDSLDLVVRSLFMVKTILAETKEFWEDTAKYIKKYLIPVCFYILTAKYIKKYLIPVCFFIFSQQNILKST